MPIGAVVSAQVVLPYRGSARPARDEAINTFWFAGPFGTETDIISTWTGPLQSLYNATTSGQVFEIGKYLSNVIDRSACKINWYFNAATPLGPFGPPNTVSSLSLPATPGDFDFPLEVALVGTTEGLTFPLTSEADLLDPVAIRSRRGRVYFGPLSSSAGTDTTSEGYPVPNGVFQTDVALALSALSSNNSTDSSWCVFSRKLSALTAITQGWVDNEWDTQRRRGVDPTSRVNWHV